MKLLQADNSKSMPSHTLLQSLSPDQRAFREAVAAHENILLIGPAGTGKSKCLQDLDAQMTAMTGVAATCVPNAITLHKFIGCGVVGDETFGSLWAQICRKTKTIDRIRAVIRLVIDEISMAHGRFILILDLLCRAARNVHDVPFGGIQVILVGDFLQLPPVAKRDDPWGQVMPFEVFCVMGFYPRRFDLRRVFRQQDPTFLAVLSEIRDGNPSSKTINYLAQCNRTIFPDDGVLPTMIYERKRQVEHENRMQMQSHPDEGEFRRLCFVAHASLAVAVYSFQLETLVYSTKDPGAARTEVGNRVRKYLDDIPLILEVRTDMQVLFRFNVAPDEFGVANGTRGVVRGWVRVPPEHCTTCIIPISNQDFVTHGHRDPELVPGPAEHHLAPVVFVPLRQQLLIVQPFTITMSWDASLDKQLAGVVPPPPREVIVLRIMPFVYGWALTIHRVQGMTLDRVKMVLPPGKGLMASAGYVVISRVRDPRALLLVNEPTRRHFWTLSTCRQYFGSSAAKAAFGQVWVGPDLDPSHCAHLLYQQWAQEARMSIFSSTSGHAPVGSDVRVWVRGEDGELVDATSSRSCFGAVRIKIATLHLDNRPTTHKPKAAWRAQKRRKS